MFRAPFAYPQQPSVAISEFATDPSTEGMPAGSVAAQLRRARQLRRRARRPRRLDASPAARPTDSARATTRPASPTARCCARAQTWLAAVGRHRAGETADASYHDGVRLPRQRRLGGGCRRRTRRQRRRLPRQRDGPQHRASEPVHEGALAHHLRTRPAADGDLPAHAVHRRRRRRLRHGAGDPGRARPAPVGRPDGGGCREPVECGVVVRGRARASDARRAGRGRLGTGRTVECSRRSAGAQRRRSPRRRASASAEHPLDVAAAADARRQPTTATTSRTCVSCSTPRPSPPATPIAWTGSTVGRNELQFSVWNPASASWRLLDAATPRRDRRRSARRQRHPRAAFRPPTRRSDGGIELLVQNGPRTERTLSDGRRRATSSDPDDYDLAISHITDTQYLTESYPEVYTGLVSWIAANADGSQDRLRHPHRRPGAELGRPRPERAARAARVRAGIGHPGHPRHGRRAEQRAARQPRQQARRRATTLFNEYFPPERYAATPEVRRIDRPGRQQRELHHLRARRGARS